MASDTLTSVLAQGKQRASNTAWPLLLVGVLAAEPASVSHVAVGEACPGQGQGQATKPLGITASWPSGQQ